MQIHIPESEQVPPSYDAPRKITPLPSPVARFSDEVGMDEEKAACALNSQVKLGVQSEPSFPDVSPKAGYVPEKGLYFAGRRPDCNIVGLARSTINRSNQQVNLTKVDITRLEYISKLGSFLRENDGQPYTIFVIDALNQTVFPAVQEVVQAIEGNRLYFNHKPLVSVVEKGAQGLLSRLQERYSGTPLRFIEAKKYGTDVIDAQLLGQLRY